MTRGYLLMLGQINGHKPPKDNVNRAQFSSLLFLRTTKKAYAKKRMNAPPNNFQTK